MNRRDLLAVAIAAPVVISAPAVAATGGSGLFYAELDAIDALTAHLNAHSVDEAEWDRWEQWTNRVWREIEALPPSEENAKLKARAIWSIIEGNVDDLNQGQSTVCRMVRQIVSSLAGVGRNG